MNKQNHHLMKLPVLLIAGLSIAGCQEDKMEGYLASPGEAIEFAVGSVTTRTAYVSDNQIDWTGGEQIRIYSDVADKKNQLRETVTPGTAEGWTNNALYTVTPVTGDGEHQYHGEFTATNGEYLAWSALSDTHEFYGIYPDERLNIDGSTPSNGLFQLQFISNQTCKVTSAENGSYIAAPDMLNAYMVAHNRVVRTENHVLLDFDPIMTTLDITIRAGGYEVATGIIQPLTVTGVSVTLPNGLGGKEYFTYNATNIQNSTEEGVSQGQGELTDELKNGQSESVFVSFVDESGNPMEIPLSEGDSIRLTAFLPPIPGDKTVETQIRVHTAENFDFSATLKRPLQAQYKVVIPLPDVKPDSPKNTKWITELDGNIYLKQLSIPGAYCNENNDAEVINKLLSMGVRAFNVKELEFLHVDWGESYYAIPEEIVKAFNLFLQNNPHEFLFIYGEKNLETDFKEYSVPYYTLTTENVGSITLTDIRGKIITAWKGRNYFVQNGKNETGLVNVGKLFPCKNSSETDFQLALEGWNNWDSNGAISNWGEQNLEDSAYKAAIYDQTIQYRGQRGYTGIVTLHDIEYSDDMINITDEQLIQAIINCNFKFILDRK